MTFRLSERVSNSLLYIPLNSTLTLSIASLSTANNELQAALEEARKTISTLEQALAAATLEDPVNATDEGSVKKPAVPKGKRIAIFDSMGPRVSRDQYKAIQVCTLHLLT